MREIIKLKRVSVRNDAEACVTRLMRETWHLCKLLPDLHFWSSLILSKPEIRLKSVEAMRRLYRITLQRSEMDSTGQIAPTLAMYYAIHARVRVKPLIIQNKYFCSLCSYETFHTKALEYKESFTHIGF